MGTSPDVEAPFSLSEAERHSPVWLRLKAHCTDRLQQLRVKNDALMPEEERNVLIGRIKEIKRVLELDVPPQPYAALDGPARHL